MPPVMPPGLYDMTRTPAVAMTIAIIIGRLTASPRNISPKIATWIGSVLMYATTTTNERPPIAASISAVAAICASAPTRSQGQ